MLGSTNAQPLWSDAMVAKTNAQMQSLLTLDNVGRLVQFMGPTDSTYANGRFYIIGLSATAPIIEKKELEVEGKCFYEIR